MPTSELYCRQLRKSENDGLLTDLALTLLSFSTQYDYGDANYDDDALIEILCTMSNSNIRKICATYQQIFSKRLDQEIREGKTGNYKKLLLILSEGNRDESISCDPQSAKNQAIVLEKKLSQSFTDEKTIIEMLAKKSFRQINLISEEYRKRTGNLLEKDIKKRMSAKLKDALVAIVRASKNIAEFYARRINKSINYFNLDHHNLGRLIVARCEIDLMNIQDEFKFIFRESLQSRMETITSGNYKHALLTLLNA
ncbi:CLUMA_CG005233, isoform A [Clunio marinus]|uniref:CLUMA_CG005233, isoform A n=1 Tax=Clunio marinus TaxID=568069 RepID=A0A1J1HUA1_9DIPT|nr:CLUMA_CG005233, isoform A [Clunio marinus]